MNNQSGYRVRRKKKFKYWIVTDKDGKPMAWDDVGKQLAYCTDNTWEDVHHPVMVYTLAKANRLIRKSTDARKKNKSPLTEYKLMPVEPVFNPVRQNNNKQP